MLKKNDTAELEITELNDLGYGVARHMGMVVFVRGAVDGDRVLARIIKKTHTYAVAKTEKVLMPSPLRTDGFCPVCDSCGGCVYSRITYEHEQSIKLNGVRTALDGAGLSKVELHGTVLGTGQTEHYRNKAQYPVSRLSEQRVSIGFFSPGSHRVIEAADCRLQPPQFAKILEIIRGFLEKEHISIYDESTGHGNLRHICLRRGEITGEIMLVLVIRELSVPGIEKLTDELIEKVPGLVGILYNINPEKTNVIYGKRFITVWGRDYITDKLCGVDLRLSAPSFYQVNHDAAEILYKKAAELAELSGTENVLDLFCGVGSIGLSMAEKIHHLVGIEIIREAVECALLNAEQSHIENASFICGDASDTRSLLKMARSRIGEAEFDLVILDPPRKGCTPELISFLCESNIAKIVYISCNPHTFARDAALFASQGYTIGKVTAVDMFPRTAHVETVCCIAKAANIRK